MEKGKFKFGLILLIFCYVISFNIVNAEKNETTKNVLFISSYNPNFISFNDQINGIKKELGKDVIVQIEYMDSKTFSQQQNEKNFYNLLKYKLNNYKKFDAIILGDDQALNFGIKYRNDLFKGIPIIFLGVSEIELIEKTKKLDDVYGITEFLSIEDNVKLISKFHSGKNVIAIDDDPIETSEKLSEFYSLKEKYKNINFKHMSLSDMTFEELKKELSKLDNDDVFLLIYAYRDKVGNTMEVTKLATYMSENIKIPIYCMLDYPVYNGLLGGKVVTHLEQGKRAGQMANDILYDKQPKIKIVDGHDVNKYIFNYEQLKKYNIRKKDLPQGSEIINDPIDMLIKYRGVVFVTFVVFISLVIVIIVLILYMIKRLHYEKELVKAKELAESANKAKTNFISNISHELRTPVAVIMSSNQLLDLNMKKVNNEYSQSNHKNINIIKQNCYRLLRLTNNIIDMAKIDSGFMSLRLKNIDIIFLLESMVTSVIPYAQIKNIDIIFDTSDEELIMSVDPDKIERIVLNLISNAIKFSKNDTSIIVNVEKKDNILLFSVKDTGIGMHKKHLDSIFDKFTQIDDTMVRKNEGSGIGLSLVKSFVNLHEGNIRVKSEVGKGSEFIVELPIKVLEENCDDINNYEMEQDDSAVIKTIVEFSDIYF